MNKDEIMNQLKKILKKYPDKQREILLYIFGRDNLIKMINEPTYEELLKENKELKLELSGYRQAILNNKEMLGLKEDNDKLKKQLEDMTLCRDIASGHRKEVQDRETILLNQQKEFISYLENEKDRLSRECSQIYEDSLGKTRLVNEDIFNEVNDILQKYKSIIGVLGGKKEDCNILINAFNENVEILDEEEFEDIKDITQDCFDNWTCAKHINQLIKNQKKIIEKLKNI